MNWFDAEFAPTNVRLEYAGTAFVIRERGLGLGSVLYRILRDGTPSSSPVMTCMYTFQPGGVRPGDVRSVLDVWVAQEVLES